MAWRRESWLSPSADTKSVCVCLCTSLDLLVPQFPQPLNKGQNSKAQGPFQLQHLGFLWREGGMGAPSAFPLPFLAFLIPCYPFISSYPGLPAMVCRSLPLSRSGFFCLPLLFSASESTSDFISLSVTPPSASFSLSLCSSLRFSV